MASMTIAEDVRSCVTKSQTAGARNLTVARQRKPAKRIQT